MDVLKISDHVKEIMGLVEKIFQVIDRFETSRPGSIGFTKLEEAVLWLQVMAQQVPLKAVPDAKPADVAPQEPVVGSV